MMVCHSYKGGFMRLKSVSILILSVLFYSVFAQELAVGTTISSNRTGRQGNYYVEYWKDGGSGTMTLGEGCNFSCQWGQVNNILFRKGVRPGSKNEIVVYEADYQPTGNSYLSIYGWFKNPLVEYYIIESWGSWKPPNDKRSKGTIETDGGTYDIYQNSRTGPSIEGNKTFQQYWSVRQSKRTSGTITCANHFDAWKSKGMTIGSFYEVSFNVEAYQSGGGKADVKVTIDTIGATGANNGSKGRRAQPVAGAGGANGLQHVRVTANHSPAITFDMPAEGYASMKVYDLLGREVATLGGKVYSAGQHSITFNTSRLTSGVYHYTVKTGE